MSLTQISELLRSRKLSARALLDFYLQRIDSPRGRDLHGYISVAREVAQSRARALDEAAARGQWAGPLHGLPIAVKDNIDAAGLRTTAGTELFAKWRPTSDAPVVAALRAAGAIIIGKTSLDPLCMGTSTRNATYGHAKNPHDLGRTPGGSSGGSALVVADGQCAAALGTDTGGSIRIPSALCGVVGFKPSLGLVSRSKVFTLLPSLDCVGPLT